MKKAGICLMLILLIGLSAGKILLAEQTAGEARLAVLWTSGDLEVAEKMVMIYAYNAKKYGWFDRIKFIVWGPSTKLLSQTPKLQQWIKKMKNIGVELFACKWCAEQYKVSAQLKNMGIEVIYYGKPLSELIKTGWKVMTF